MFNPIVYFVSLFRYSMLGISDVPIYTAVWVLISATIILYAIAWLLIHKGVGIKT